MCFSYFFFFQAEDGIRDVAVTGVQTCALPICMERLLLRGNYPAIATHDVRILEHAKAFARDKGVAPARFEFQMLYGVRRDLRSEEHTSELQSRLHLVCRLLLEKKKKEENQRTH